VCKCVLYCCQRLTTQVQLTNIHQIINNARCSSMCYTRCSRRQAAYLLHLPTLHIAAVATAWPLPGSPPDGHAAVHRDCSHSCSRCGPFGNGQKTFGCAAVGHPLLQFGLILNDLLQRKYVQHGQDTKNCSLNRFQ
jgi:hypothetical protein